MGRKWLHFNLWALLLLAAQSACARPGQGPARDRNLIAEDEIASIEASTAYDIVRRLRGDFLRSRGPVTRLTGSGSSQRPTPTNPSISVFVDGIESGTVERTLHLIPANDVLEIRLYRSADAATKFGTRHNGGVVEVITKRENP